MDDLLDVVHEFIKGETEAGTGEGCSKCLSRLEVSRQLVRDRLIFPASITYSYNQERGSQEYPNGYTQLKISHK